MKTEKVTQARALVTEAALKLEGLAGMPEVVAGTRRLAAAFALLVDAVEELQADAEVAPETVAQVVPISGS